MNKPFIKLIFFDNRPWILKNKSCDFFVGKFDAWGSIDFYILPAFFYEGNTTGLPKMVKIGQNGVSHFLKKLI